MSPKSFNISPLTRISGLLSVNVVFDNGMIIDALASSTMFRGFEWAMKNRHVTDAVYMTQRVCGICSLAHGAVSSYLLDELYDNEISETAQLLRNIMYAADFLQNHLRHFYIFSIPDFVQMPQTMPFHCQDLEDLRLTPEQTQRIIPHVAEAIKAAQKAHEILTVFGGKAPHQHSFLHGGVAVAPTVDKLTRASFLLQEIQAFVKQCLIPDTQLLADVYQDYFHIGNTPRRLLSFGLFRFGPKNEKLLWRSGVLDEANIPTVPDLSLIQEDVETSWFTKKSGEGQQLSPSPRKPGAYTWVKTVKYAGQCFQVGPLARMIITGRYAGGTSTMDRIVARSQETMLLTELMHDWLTQIQPSETPPLTQNSVLVKQQATFPTDAMRGALLHSVRLEGEHVAEYNIITPTVWNFSARDASGNHSPVEDALIGTTISRDSLLNTTVGRIVRSFDPCISCATH